MTVLHRSIAFSAIERYGAYGIGLVATAVSARLLTPQEFGIFALGATLMLLVEGLRDFGAGSYLVQVRDASREVIRASVTVSFIVASACTALLIVAARPAASFYGEPGVADVLLVLAGSCIIIPFSAAPLAMLRRTMAFATLAAISLLSAAVSAATLISLAWLGWGSLALAYAGLAGALAHTVAANVARPMPWALVPKLSASRAAFTFGAWSSATAFANILHGAMPQLIIGRLLGVGAVGLYDRTRIICQLPDRLIVSALNPVLLPALSEHVRRGGSVREPYLLGLRYMAAVQWPALICLVLLADPIVQLLLGPQWPEVPHLVRITAGGLFWLVAAPLSYPTLVAMGRVRETLTTTLISIPPSIAVIAFAAQHGLEAVAASGWVTAPFQVFVVVSVIRRHAGIAWSEIGEAVAPGLVAAAGATIGPLLAIALHGFRLELPVTSLLVAVPVAAVGHLVALRLIRHPLYASIAAIAFGLAQRLRRVRRVA
jgi:O-antigen/teichoic acid export membrane protein